MQNWACNSRLKFSSSRAWFSKNRNQGSLYLYTMLGGFFPMGRNLPLWPTGKVIRKTCPFREIPVRRKGRGQTRRRYYGKNCSKKVGLKLYSLYQLCSLQHNAFQFMTVKFRTGELQSFKSTPLLSCGGFWPLEKKRLLGLQNGNWKEITWITKWELKSAR